MSSGCMRNERRSVSGQDGGSGRPNATPCPSPVMARRPISGTPLSTQSAYERIRSQIATRLEQRAPTRVEDEESDHGAASADSWGLESEATDSLRDIGPSIGRSAPFPRRIRRSRAVWHNRRGAPPAGRQRDRFVPSDVKPLPSEQIFEDREQTPAVDLAFFLQDFYRQLRHLAMDGKSITTGRRRQSYQHTGASAVARKAAAGYVRREDRIGRPAMCICPHRSGTWRDGRRYSFSPSSFLRALLIRWSVAVHDHKDRAAAVSMELSHVAERPNGFVRADPARSAYTDDQRAATGSHGPDPSNTLWSFLTSWRPGTARQASHRASRLILRTLSAKR